MDQKKTDQRRSFIINVLYFAVIALLIHVGIKYVLNWIMPFLIGFTIAYILKPIINGISKKLEKIPVKLIASIIVILFYILILAVIFLIGWQIVDFVGDFVAKLPDTYNNYIAPAISKLGDFFNDIVNKFAPDLGAEIVQQSADWMKYLQSAVDKLSGAVASGVGSAGKRMPGFLTTMVFAVLSSVFITLDYRRVVNGLLSVFPVSVKKSIFRFKNYLTDTAFKYVKAMSMVMGIIFVILCIGLGILGIDSFIIVSALVAITDALPVLGVGTILLPWAFIDFVKGDTSQAIGLLILYITIAIIRQIIEPRIVGQQLGIHPVLTLLCVYLGLRWMGFLGMIILLISTIIFVNYVKSGENPFKEQDPEEIKEDS